MGLSRYVWITAEMIFFAIHFSPRAPSTPDLHFFAFLRYHLSCTVTFHHLDWVSFRIVLAPVPSFQTVIHPLAIRSVIFRFQKDIVFRSVRLDILFDVVDRLARCASELHPLTLVFSVQRYRTLL